MLVEADDNNLIAKEKPLKAHKGLIDGRNIAIKKDMTETEKKCVMAEELGHYYTATGEILDQSSVSNRKLELRGRAFAYNKLVGLTGIVGAYKHGCASLTESAEYLDVTEEFLAEALNYYKAKYGKGARIDNYMIYFEPCLGVFEMI
ncbi:ImmA/IrrE family metallo-endopeptidase [bacterium D16-50]|nr:ImmA/IrrE family metallo-endopeptidase [bacterium D16-50]